MRLFAFVAFLLALLGAQPSQAVTVSNRFYHVTSPINYRVFQRDASDRATVPVQISYPTRYTNVTALVRIRWPQKNIIVQNWTNLVITNSEARAQFSLPAGGWYQFDVRFYKNGHFIREFNIYRVGVGEVLIAAGQSNACHPGETPNRDTTRLVSTVVWNPKKDPRAVASWKKIKWRHAVDPLLPASIADGGGSPWIFLGERIAERYKIPVGIISVGAGGTSSMDWMPTKNGRNLHRNISNALNMLGGANGARAVLWHQGEADAKYISLGKFPTHQTYTNLNLMIQRVRKDSWNIPWIMARAAYNPHVTAQSFPYVIADQNLCILRSPGVIAGPNTDDYVGPQWRKMEGTNIGVHLNNYALQSLSALWLQSIEDALGLVP